MATVVEGDPKAPFSVATTPRCRGGHYSFPRITPFYPYNAECCNLRSSLIRCGTRPIEWGTQWDLNSLLQVCDSSLLTITLPEVLSKEVSCTIFKVFGMIRYVIEPRASRPLANTLPTRPVSRFQLIYLYKPTHDTSNYL